MNPELSEDEEKALLEIREKFRIEPVRFRQGFFFCMEVLAEETRVDSYMKAFEVDREKASTLASQLYNSKWIQAIAEIMTPDVSIIDAEHLVAIKEEMATIMVSGEETKDKIAAAKVLESVIKKREKKKTTEEESVGLQASDVVQMLLQVTAGAQKMIGNNGQIIDVEVMP